MVASWVTRSSSSVVTPGATAAATSSSTSAAITPATRMRSMTEGDDTGEPRSGGGWPVCA